MSTTSKFIDKFNDTQTLPHVVTKLSKLINDPDSTMKNFEDIIKMDPVLVARLLRIVNSAYYGLSQKVESISRAVAFLGMKNLHNLAVTDALKNIFSNKEGAGKFSSQKLWMHCAAVGICSKMLAERIFGINGDDAYLCGILHDFGHIIEVQVAQTDFLQVCDNYGPATNIIALEENHLGTNHCEIGRMLTSQWEMSEHIQQAIADHHDYTLDTDPDSLSGILQIAEYITVQMGYKMLDEATPQIAPCFAAHIEENMDEYRVLIEDLPAEMEKAKDMHGKEED